MAQQLTNILLETGTNELEIIEFLIYVENDKGEEVPQYYGINVAKVREIIKTPTVTDVPKTNPNIEGMVNLRGEVIPMINLPKWLNLKTTRKLTKVIITEFNEVVNGFMVNEVNRIYRISWQDVMQPSELSGAENQNCITSVIRMGEKLILMLDFEKILGDIFPDTYFKAGDIEVKTGVKGKKILIAEDSPGIRKMLIKTLEKGGYKVIEAENGKVALTKIMEIYAEVLNEGKDVNDFLDLIITDLEMPLIDGSHLIKKVREIKEFNKVPIIVFSSMASEEMKNKIKALGVDAFISKPELPRLVDLSSNLILQRKNQ